MAHPSPAGDPSDSNQSHQLRRGTARALAVEMVGNHHCGVVWIVLDTDGHWASARPQFFGINEQRMNLIIGLRRLARQLAFLLDAGTMISAATAGHGSAGQYRECGAEGGWRREGQVDE
jgi:hypothetical protein